MNKNIIFCIDKICEDETMSILVFIVDNKMGEFNWLLIIEVNDHYSLPKPRSNFVYMCLSMQ